MILTGTVVKDGTWWVIQCPVLDAMTQGRTKQEALEMMVDWVQSMLGDAKYPIDIQSVGKNDFNMRMKDFQPILQMVMERARSNAQMTYEDVAKTLNRASRSSVKMAFTMTHDPRFGKLTELADAMGYEIEIRLHKRADKDS